MTVYFQSTELEGFTKNLSPAVSEVTEDWRRRSTYSRESLLLSGGVNAYAEGTLTEEVDAAWVRTFWRQSDGAVTPRNGFELCDATGAVIACTRAFQDRTFSLAYWNGAAFVELGTRVTGAQDMALGPLDFRYSRGTGADGILQLYWNNTLVAEAFNLNLTSRGELAKIRLRNLSFNADAYSETVVTDEPTIGWAVSTVVPTTNGTDLGGIGVIGNINEVVMDLNTYIAMDSDGEKRSTRSPARTLGDNRVPKCVSIDCRAMKTGDTGPQNIRAYLMIGGVRYFGDTRALTTNPDVHRHLWQLNPATGEAWTNDEVNDASMEFGWEAVA